MGHFRHAGQEPSGGSGEEEEEEGEIWYDVDSGSSAVEVWLLIITSREIDRSNFWHRVVIKTLNDDAIFPGPL